MLISRKTTATTAVKNLKFSMFINHGPVEVPSASNKEHCICIVADLFVVRSCLELFCFLSVILFVLAICTPSLIESTRVEIAIIGFQPTRPRVLRKLPNLFRKGYCL